MYRILSFMKNDVSRIKYRIVSVSVRPQQFMRGGWIVGFFLRYMSHDDNGNEAQGKEFLYFIIIRFLQ